MPRTVVTWLPALTLTLTLGFAATAAAHSFSVPATGERLVITGFVPGAWYQLRVSGVMDFGPSWRTGRLQRQDACYEVAEYGYPVAQTAFSDTFGITLCGEFRSDHTYVSEPFIALGTDMTVWVFDTDYLGNSGALSLEIRALAPTPPAWESGYCVLRKPDLFQPVTEPPPVCYQFYLAAADAPARAGSYAWIQGGACWLTDYALRQGWQLDPYLGGPHATWSSGDQAMTLLSRFGGDFYGCIDESRRAGPVEDDLDPIDEERDMVLDACDRWAPANSGGVKGTLDRWDLSSIPFGASIDLRFDALSIPDRFIVEYPRGRVVHDTGWRGDRRYEDPALYPGGVVSPGQGTVEGVTVKAGDDTLVVRVYGRDPQTRWHYSLRCTTR